MKKQNIMKIIASALAICVAVGTMPTAAWAAENSLSEGSGSVGASNPGGGQSSGVTSKSGAASAGAVSSDGFSDEGYTDGGEISMLNIDDLAEKTKYTVGEGHIYYAPAKESGSAFLRLENVPEIAGSLFYISGESEISLTVEVAGSNSVHIYMANASVTLAGSGDFNPLYIVARNVEKDGFTGKLNAVIGIEAENRLDYTVYGEYYDYIGMYMVGSFLGEIHNTLTISRGASFTLPEGSRIWLSGDNGDYSKYLNIEGDFINNGNVICLGAEPDDPSTFVEELGFSGTGIVTVSSASDPNEIENSNPVDYDNHGFQDMGVVDKGAVDIGDAAPKCFYRTDTRNRGKLYYTPPTADSPVLLKACNINADVVVSCMGDISIPVTLCVEGEYNCFTVAWNTDVTLDGTGGFAGDIITFGEFSIAESFKGELNARIAQQTIEQSDNAMFAKADTIVYGEYYQMEEEDRLAFYESMTDEGATAQVQATLRIPEGSTYIIGEDCTANIANVGNDYEKYLKIDGKLINNGLIVCDGDVPDDPAAFIQSLNLSGFGVVAIRHQGSDGGTDTRIYSNDGIELKYEGDLNFEDNTTDQVWGDHMEEYGYCFEEKNGSYVLTIKDFKTPDRVCLPSDKPIIINSSGVCVIGELSISTETDDVDLSFEGDGTLTVAKKFWIEKQGTVSIAEGAKITAKNGFDGGEVRLSVYGSLTAMCDETKMHSNAVYVNVLDIASTGSLEVSGSRGVWIDRLSSSSGYSLSIEEGGQLVADCGEHGLVVCQRGGGESGPGAIMGIPEEYLPHGYEYIQASEQNEYTPAVSLVLARKGSQITVSAEGRYITEGKGAEGYLVIHRHSEDYDTYIPDPDDPGQHIKCCSNGGHTHFDSAEKHTGGTADCSHQAVCTICNQPYGDKDSSQHGDTEVRGTVEASCTESGYTGDTYCKDCGEKLETGDEAPALGHDWLLTHEEPATITSEGKKIYTCSRCGQTREESIPKLPPTPTGTPTPAEATAEPTKQVKESVTPEEMRKNSEKLDSGISIKWKGNALALKWQKAAGAGGYDIFAAQSGKKMNKKSLVKTVKNGKTSVSLAKIAGKKISGEKAYSVKIKAWKYVGSKKIYTGESKTYHIVGKENKKYTNVKKLKPAKKKYVLKKGRNIRIKVTVVKQSKKKKLLPKSYGSALRYESGNKKIATVTQKGRVKAKKKGGCYITVVALNGVRTRIRITVK